MRFRWYFVTLGVGLTQTRHAELVSASMPQHEKAEFVESWMLKQRPAGSQHDGVLFTDRPLHQLRWFPSPFRGGIRRHSTSPPFALSRFAC